VRGRATTPRIHRVRTVGPDPSAEQSRGNRDTRDLRKSTCTVTSWTEGMYGYQVCSFYSSFLSVLISFLFFSFSYYFLFIFMSLFYVIFYFFYDSFISFFFSYFSFLF